MTHGLSYQWKEALSLSRRQAPELYEAGHDVPPGPHAEAIQFALSKLGLTAVFCIEGVPTIAFVTDANADVARIDHIHRILWNQGLMSLLLVIRSDELAAYSLARRPFQRDPNSSTTDTRLIYTFSLVSDALKLKKGGFVGLLLPAMGVLHNVAHETQKARQLFIRSTRIKRIINLSDLCFQLFDDAQRPTTFAIYQPGDNSANPYSFEYWTPKADLNLRLKRNRPS